MTHVVMAELLRFGLRVERDVLHLVTENGIKVLLRVLPDDGPAHLELNDEGRRVLGPILGETAGGASGPTSGIASANVRLTPLDRRILQLLERSGALKGEAIAHRLHRRYDGYLRVRLARLHLHGLIENDGTGYRRASGGASG